MPVEIVKKLGAPKLVEAAQSVLRPERDKWPWPWVYPDGRSEPVNPRTVVAAPPNGVLTELLSFQVPDGFTLKLTGLLVTYIGTAINDAAQLVTWTIDVDIPTTVAVGLTQPVLPSGYAIRDFGSLTTHLGSLDLGPYPVSGRFQVDARKVLRIKVQTTAPFPTNPPAPVFFLSGIAGWVYPLE